MQHWGLKVSDLFSTIIIVAIGLAILAVIVSSIVDFYRDWPILSTAWSRMELFEKRLFYIGISFFILIPALKDHPAANTYISRVLIEILAALAGSFFVAGVVSFMRQVHDIRNRNG